MELELTEDDLHAYHELASGPDNYQDDGFEKKTIGPNPRGLALMAFYILKQYLFLIHVVRRAGNGWYYIPFTWFYGITSGFIFLLNKSNPGVLKKSTDLERYLSDAAPATIVVLHNHRFIQRWCVDCQIYKPPRVKHCYECGHCVSRFDHHCQWLSNCIGGNNYKLFMLFGLYQLALLCYSFSFTLNCVLKTGFFKGIYNRFDFWLSFAYYETALSFILMFFGISALMAAYAVLVQLYFIAKNTTYYEYLTDPYQGINPFNRGLLENLRSFSKLPISLPYYGQLSQLFS